MTPPAVFLNEGAKSYVDALAAIEAFEEKVRSVCRDIYEKYRPQLVSKVGLEDEDCEDYDGEFDRANRYAELGVFQESPSRRETFYVYLRWDGTEDVAPEISACVNLEFSTKGDRNGYAKLLRTIPSIQFGDDASYPYLWSSRKLTDLSTCTETLGGLLSEWLAGWPAGLRLKQR
ncbi:MAG: hypothetical protein ACLQPN_12985 [Bryobacteraceae bacterium]